MTRFPPLLVALAACIMIAACASQPGRRLAARSMSARQCFTPREVFSFGATKDRNVDVQVGASRYFRLELGGGCPDINWARGIAIRTTGGGLFICEGYDAELIVPDPAGTQRCPVSAVHQISRQQYFAERRY